MGIKAHSTGSLGLALATDRPLVMLCGCSRCCKSQIGASCSELPIAHQTGQS